MTLYYGLLLFILLDYVRPTSYLPVLNVLHLNSVVPLAVLAGSLLSRRSVATSEVLGSPNARWIMFLFLLIIVSGLTCDVQLYAFSVFIELLSCLTTYMLLRKEVYDVDRIKGTFTALLVAHVLVGLLTPEMFSGDGERHKVASGSFLGDGNDFSLSLNITLPMGLYLFAESKTTMRKMLYATMLVLLVMAVLATQSRGGVLALACMGTYLWLKSNKKVIGLFGLMAMMAIVLVAAPPQLFDRLGKLSGEEEIDESAQGRLLAWGAGMRMAVDHPLLGVGAGHFPVKYGAEYRPEGYGLNDIPWQNAHSSYFLILGELGIPGITFLLGILTHNILANRRTLREFKHAKTAEALSRYRLMQVLTASWIAFAVGGAFVSAAYYPHIYLLAGFSECARRICAQPTAVNEAQDEGIVVHSSGNLHVR